MTTTLPTDTAVRFFIAVPANGDDGIYGIGHTAEAALQDAYKGSQTSHERQALEAEGRGFASQPATERLYVHVERYGCDANQPGFRWKKGTDGLIDLDLGDDEDRLGVRATRVGH